MANDVQIDVIIDAKQAANLPAPKGLSERITYVSFSVPGNRDSNILSAPKAQPKSAAAKPKAETAGRGGRGGRGRGRGGRTNAPKKTNEELDSEMADYWTAGAAAETNGTAAPAAATTDAPMEDEILVGTMLLLGQLLTNKVIVSTFFRGIESKHRWHGMLSLLMLMRRLEMCYWHALQSIGLLFLITKDQWTGNKFETCTRYQLGWKKDHDSQQIVPK